LWIQPGGLCQVIWRHPFQVLIIEPVRRQRLAALINTPTLPSTQIHSTSLHSALIEISE
jgi:hypothetical protein